MSGKSGTGGKSAPKKKGKYSAEELEVIRNQEFMNRTEFAAVVGTNTTSLREDWIDTGLLEATNRGTEDNPKWDIHRSQVDRYVELSRKLGRVQREFSRLRPQLVQLYFEFAESGDERWTEAQTPEKAFEGFLIWAKEKGHDAIEDFATALENDYPTRVKDLHIDVDDEGDELSS